MTYLQDLALQIAAHVRFNPAVMGAITTGVPYGHNRATSFEFCSKQKLKLPQLIFTVFLSNFLVLI